MMLFSKYRKRRLITRLRKSIVVPLAKDYGRSDHYTAEQVIATLRRNKYTNKYDSLAVAMFCTQESFTTFHGHNDGSENYASLRSDIGDVFFNGRHDYKQTEIMAVGAGGNRGSSGDNGGYGHGDTAVGGDGAGGGGD